MCRMMMLSALVVMLLGCAKLEEHSTTGELGVIDFSVMGDYSGFQSLTKNPFIKGAPVFLEFLVRQQQQTGYVADLTPAVFADLQLALDPDDCGQVTSFTTSRFLFTGKKNGDCALSAVDADGSVVDKLTIHVKDARNLQVRYQVSTTECINGQPNADDTWVAYGSDSLLHADPDLGICLVIEPHDDHGTAMIGILDLAFWQGDRKSADAQSYTLEYEVGLPAFPNVDANKVCIRRGPNGSQDSDDITVRDDRSKVELPVHIAWDAPEPDGSGCGGK